MLLNQIVEFAKFRAAKATRFYKRDGREPKLGVTLGLLDMDVVRLCSLTAKEEKTVSVDTKHIWHGGIISVESIKATVLREHKAPIV